MNSRVLSFVIVFILIVIAGFTFGPKWIKEEPVEVKEPLNLDYDVNLPANGTEPVMENKKEPAVTGSLYPVPDLNRPVVIYSELPEETKKLAKERIVAITKTLKHDNVLFEDWLELGTYRKLIGDYDAALEVWLYASKLDPASSVSYNNIANLYANYIRNYEKAEWYYLKAIEVAPNQSYYYFAAFEFYKSVLKNDQKARDIVRKGIAAAPEAKAELGALLD